MRRVCRKRPTKNASTRPATPGMEVSRPTWKLLAPRRARKTGRNGAAADASPTPMASIWTLRKLRLRISKESSENDVAMQLRMIAEEWA